jgi:hypothetical protein
MLMKLALALKVVEAVAGQVEGMKGVEGMEEEEEREGIRLLLHLILPKTHKIYS